MFIDWFCMIESNQLVESNPIANSFIRDDVLSHNKKLIKSDCINITLCTTGHFPTISIFFHWKNSTMCKQNLAVSLFSTLKNQYQGLMKNVIDRPCHQGSFQNLNLTLNDLKNDLPLVLVQLESIFEFLKIVKIFYNQLKVSAEFRKTRERYRR